MNIPEIDLPVYEAMARKEDEEACCDRCDYWYCNSGVLQEILLSDVLHFINNNVTIISGSTPQRREMGYKLLKLWDLKRYGYSNPYYSQQSEECKAYIRNLI